MPCIGESTLDFDFYNCDLAHTNLGGLGPDTNAPASIRYVNVGSADSLGIAAHMTMDRRRRATTISAPSPRMYFDLVVTNRSAYRPDDATRNGLNGRFAQINFAANTQVDLRVTVTPSCCTRPNCWKCMDTGLSEEARAACFTAGCCCLGQVCHEPFCCAGAAILKFSE